MRRLVASVLLAAASLPAWGRSPGQDALDQGVSEYKQGRFQDALGSFQRAVDLDPSLIKAWENMGWARHRLGDDAEALRLWHTVLKLEPANVSSWNAVGEVELARGANRDAAAALERSLALDGSQPDVRLRLGEAYEKLDRDDAAAAQYRAILSRKRGDEKATLRLADLEEARGRLDDAEAVLRAGLGRDVGPEGPVEMRLARVLAKRGDVAFAQGLWDDAAGAYTEAASRDPERPVYLSNLGWARRRGGENGEAVAAWKLAIERGSERPADLWRAIGDAERDAGRPAEARAAYERAAKAAPGTSSALISLAAVALDDGDTQGAAAAVRSMTRGGAGSEEEIVRAADLFIRHEALAEGQALFESLPGPSARVALARIHSARGGAAYRAGQDAEAAGFYRKALDADPKNRAALRDSGWASWRLGDWDAVRDVWHRYAAAYPDLSEPHELAARLELHHGSPARAIEEAKAALAIDPAALTPQRLLTRAYLADGKYKSARDLAATLAGRYPDDPATQTLYGEALWRSLDYETAGVQWKKVIDMGAGTPRATHYWLRSLYETGHYDEAISEAEAAVGKGAATEPVLRLLAEDAVVRGDRAARAYWYRQLAERFPQRVAYWTALADTYRVQEEPRKEAEVLDEAASRHPDSPEIELLRASSALATGKSSLALTRYEALGERLGRNQTVFEGQVDALRGLGHRSAALALLRTDGPGYLDANELALEQASILEDLGRRDEAEELRGGVVAPPPGTVELPILLYHGIADHPRTMSLPLASFEEQMRAIKDAGYTTITIAELDAMIAGRRPFPPKPIAVTFDDARSDSFQYADPVLARLGMKATMFVPTVRIADESSFSTDWATLKRLGASGRWDFQAHGHLAHDPIPVDADGGIAEFLVNRQWLADEGRLETHEEFVARVEGDYETCGKRLAEHLTGLNVVGYAFPFSEMGQLHGGNDPEALAVNQRAFGARYRYGFVQESSGYNTLVPGEQRFPRMLHRIDVRRDWDAKRLMAHLASQSAAQRARLDGARAAIANAEYRRAESDVRAMIEERPDSYAQTGVVLAADLHEQNRDREAARAYAQLPSGPGWGTPEPSQRRLERNLAWETDPQAGFDVQAGTDSDDRDTLEMLVTGRYPLGAPIDLWGSAGSARFGDAVFETLSGFQGTLGADWVGLRHTVVGGWLRGRSLGAVSTVEGEASFRTALDGQRFGAACGVTDVETVGALREEIQRRGCQGAYDVFGRTWRSRVRVSYGDLTDGNAVTYGWADGTVDVWARYRLAVGGRVELGDSRTDSPFYYAPSGLVSLLGVVRFARSFPSGASLDAEAGVGPSRDDNTSGRVVGQARIAWTQDWGTRWRSTVAADYGETPDYRRTGLSVSFGYRF
ncbi:MAG TPA: tetratricopeptide repeat protein [Candidatus Bathyarchaeia archaeon]|nr:tetratricopeptide repeat protein [Candidatus Bathyarchaeia archaeon]